MKWDDFYGFLDVRMCMCAQRHSEKLTLLMFYVSDTPESQVHSQRENKIVR